MKAASLILFIVYGTLLFSPIASQATSSQKFSQTKASRLLLQLNYKGLFNYLSQDFGEEQQEADYYLANILFTERSKYQDKNKALALFKKNAHENHLQSQLYLCSQLENEEEAFLWCKRAMGNGGKTLKSAGSTKIFRRFDGKKRLMLLAELGEVTAQEHLALNLAQGWNGFKQDFEEAIYWYEQAAHQGSWVASYNLGWLYFSGQGVEKNYTIAKEHVIQSLNKGLPLEIITPLPGAEKYLEWAKAIRNQRGPTRKTLFF